MVAWPSAFRALPAVGLAPYPVYGVWLYTPGALNTYVTMKKRYLITITMMAAAVYRFRKPLKYELMYQLGTPEFKLEHDDELLE